MLGIALVAGATAGAALDATLGLSGPTTIRSRAVTPSLTQTVVGTVRRAASPARPAPVPTILPGDPNPHHLHLSDAVPTDAALIGVWYPAAHQVLVQWERDFGGRPPYEEFGLTLYEFERRNSEFPWRMVWKFRRTEEDRVARLGPVQVGDFTGDGRADLVVFVDTDGSAGCGTYRAWVNAGQATHLVLRRLLCMDQGQIVLRGSRLIVTQGLDFAGPGIHCCYRRVRTTVLRWNGARLSVIASYVGPNSRRAWPPGA